MNHILYVDSCVNRETSRTERLARALLDRLDTADAQVTTVTLEDEHLVPLGGADIDRRTAASKAGDFADPLFAYAKQFAAADEVVFAAPYWDFSFPSMLKVYVEYLCAQGVTFHYSDEGIPTGLCRARRAWYVTTAGGYIGEYDYGFKQIEALCSLYFGIKDVRSFRAEGLDIITNDVEAIMAEALAQVREAVI